MTDFCRSQLPAKSQCNSNPYAPGALLLPSDLHGGFATSREFLLQKYFSLLLPSDLHGRFATGETSVQVQNPVYKNASNHLGPNGSPRVTGAASRAYGVFSAMGVLIALSAKIDEKNRDVGRGDSGDAGGLGDGVWAVSFEFLSAFNG